MSKRKAAHKEQQRQLWQEQRRARKTIRHNTAANQEKHRQDWQPLQPDEFGMVADRRIMPRDEEERRQALETGVGQPLPGRDAEQAWHDIAAESPFPLGIVVEVSRGVCRVVVGEERLLCDIRGALIAEGTGLVNVVAVGDRVLVRPLEVGHGLVEAVLVRRSGLARPDPLYSHLKQIIAANVDQLLIVASWREPHLWLLMIDEYLIAAARNNLQAVICINKMDLAEDPAGVRTLVQPYEALGYPVLLTSVPAGLGLAGLHQALCGRTTVLAGLSGVGKSTLLMAIDPQLDLKTGTISRKFSEGRHTTTQAVMLPLSAGGYVVDTPGVREMGLAGLTSADLLDYYPDIAAVAARCRFSDCTHDHEPGCAVKAAAARHQLPAWRLENYQRLLAQMC